jgi:hypothetical protein
MEIEKQIGSAQGVNYRQPFAKTEIAGILGFRADLVVYTVCTAYRYTEALPPTFPAGISTDQILVKTSPKRLECEIGENFASPIANPCAFERKTHGARSKHPRKEN